MDFLNENVSTNSRFIELGGVQEYGTIKKYNKYN